MIHVFVTNEFSKCELWIFSFRLKAQFGKSEVQLSFKNGLTENIPGGIKVVRKKHTMDILYNSPTQRSSSGSWSLLYKLRIILPRHFRLSLPPIEKKTRLDIIHFCIDRVTFWSSFQTKTLMAPEYVKTASEVVLAIFHWRYVGSHCNVDSQFFIWYMFEPKRRKC